MKLKSLLLVFLLLAAPVFGQEFDWKRVQAVAVQGYHPVLHPGCGETIFSITTPAEVHELAATFRRKAHIGVFGCIPEYKLSFKYESGQVITGEACGWYLSLTGKSGFYEATDEAHNLLKEHACATPSLTKGFDWGSIRSVAVIGRPAMGLFASWQKLPLTIIGSQAVRATEAGRPWISELRPDILPTDGYMVLGDATGQRVLAKINLSVRILIVVGETTHVRWLSRAAVADLRKRLRPLKSG